MDDKDGFVNASLARLYLCIGGIFGLHRLYCGQPFESIIYLTTFGIFLLGPLWDVFALNRIVQSCNDRQIKAKFEDDGEIEEKSHRKNPRFAFGRFIGQVFYAVWLGFLAIILSSFLFKDTNDRLGLTLTCALAIASGVWIAGCCGNKKCEFVYALIAALSTSFFTIYWSDVHSMQSLLIISVASALNSNCSLKWKLPNDQFSTKHFMFCISLFLTCFCVLWVGLSRTVFHREIAFLSNGSTIRMKTVSIGTFFMDYALERKKDLIKEYPLNDHTIEFVPILKFGNASNVSWKRKKSPKQTINLPHLQILNLFRKFNYELELFDDQEKVAEFHWLRYLTTLITDYTRFNINNEENPLKSTLWRMYLIQSFHLDPFVTDKDLIQKCKPYKSKSEVSPNHRKNGDEKTDWSNASKIRACGLLKKAIKQN